MQNLEEMCFICKKAEKDPDWSLTGYGSALVNNLELGWISFFIQKVNAGYGSHCLVVLECPQNFLVFCDLDDMRCFAILTMSNPVGHYSISVGKPLASENFAFGFVTDGKPPLLQPHPDPIESPSNILRISHL